MIGISGTSGTSSSSSTSNSSSNHNHNHGYRAFVLSNYSELEKEEIYAQYCPLLEDLTNEQKENKLIDLVSKGNLSVDEALIIAIKEGLCIEDFKKN